MNYSPWAQEPCILFVDGNSDLRWWVKEFLEREGFKVLLARNSVEALVVGADYPFAIDLLVADSEMKIHQNGIALAECFGVLRPETQILLAAGTGINPATEWACIPRDFTRSQLIRSVQLLTGLASKEMV